MEKSIHYSETIVNELKEKKIYEKFSECILKHIVTILISIFSIGYKGKIVNFAVHSGCHRTTITHFLNCGKWNDDILESAVKQAVINIIYSESQKTSKPILCIIDDTIAFKTKPSTHAMRPIESAYFHFSHLKKKQDYGHQAISVMLSCNGITLNYAIMIYDNSVSKIELVSDIAKELPNAPNISYLLCDIWYTCSRVFDSFCKIGFYTVGALYSSRSHRAFICTNTALSNEEILDFYVQRWKIKVFFRDVKTKLAFDQYQIRSACGIQRFYLAVKAVSGNYIKVIAVTDLRSKVEIPFTLRQHCTGGYGVLHYISEKLPPYPARKQSAVPAILFSNPFWSSRNPSFHDSSQTERLMRHLSSS